MCLDEKAGVDTNMLLNQKRQEYLSNYGWYEWRLKQKRQWFGKRFLIGMTGFEGNRKDWIHK